MKIYNIQVTSIVCVYSYMPSCRYNDDDDNNYIQKQDERERRAVMIKSICIFVYIIQLHAKCLDEKDVYRQLDIGFFAKISSKIRVVRYNSVFSFILIIIT